VEVIIEREVIKIV